MTHTHSLHDAINCVYCLCSKDLYNIYISVQSAHPPTTAGDVYIFLLFFQIDAFSLMRLPLPSAAPSLLCCFHFSVVSFFICKFAQTVTPLASILSLKLRIMVDTFFSSPLPPPRSFFIARAKPFVGFPDALLSLTRAHRRTKNPK